MDCLNTFEIQLLLQSLVGCTPPPSDSTSPPYITHLINNADPTSALSESLAAILFPDSPPQHHHHHLQETTVPDWFHLLDKALETQIKSPSIPALITAVASLTIFVQENLTGPSSFIATISTPSSTSTPPPLPECPFDLLLPISSSSPINTTNGTASHQSSFGKKENTSPGDRWAAAQLTEDGEDLVGRIPLLQYLLLARKILLAPLHPDINKTEDGSTAAGVVLSKSEHWLGCGDGDGTNKEECSLVSWTWWAFRTILVQQRLLAARSASLKILLSALKNDMLSKFQPIMKGDMDKSQKEEEEGRENHYHQAVCNILSCAALQEAAMGEVAFGASDIASQHIDQACSIIDFKPQLTGALGTRTLHQQTAHAQLVVAITRSKKDGNNNLNLVDDCQVSTKDLKTMLCQADFKGTEFEGLVDDSNILEHPNIVGNINNNSTTSTIAGKQKEEDEEDAEEVVLVPENLHSLQQALIMAKATLVRKGTAADDLQPWEIAAYTDAILRQEGSQYMIHAAAVLQSSRVERKKARTRERALLRLESLTNGMALYTTNTNTVASYTSSSKSSPSSPLLLLSRLRCVYCTWFPLQVSLRREQGEAQLAAGLVGAALSLFESLELWDGLIVCYRLLDKRVAAEELIKRRLEAFPDDPRLWCALGDVSGEKRHYEEAWERSGRRNARSARSLARCALRDEDYPAAVQYFKDALNLSPLHPEAWFNLGYCYLKCSGSRTGGGEEEEEKEEEEKGNNNTIAVIINKTTSLEGAAKAFTRASHLEPDNGETWNNLAVVHMKLHHWQEAYAALTEAVKHKRDSWQTWENYGQVAVMCGQWQTVVRAVAEGAGLSEGQRVDLMVLGKLVGYVEEEEEERKRKERRREGGMDGGVGGDIEEETKSVNTDDDGEEEEGYATEMMMADMSLVSNSTTSNSTTAPLPTSTHTVAVTEAEARNFETLKEATGKLMKQIAGSTSGNSAFWGLYGRYYECIGEGEAARGCYLKRVRALQGTNWLSNGEDSFNAYGEASLALGEASLKSGGGREVNAARMHFKSVVKQSEEKWGESEMWRKLAAVLELLS